MLVVGKFVVILVLDVGEGRRWGEVADDDCAWWERVIDRQINMAVIRT
jgi:hypothetical protein